MYAALSRCFTGVASCLLLVCWLGKLRQELPMASSERHRPSDQTVLREVSAFLRACKNPDNITFKQVRHPHLGVAIARLKISAEVYVATALLLLFQDYPTRSMTSCTAAALCSLSRDIRR